MLCIPMYALCLSVMYVYSMSQDESHLLTDIRQETHMRFPSATRMLSSHIQGRYVLWDGWLPIFNIFWHLCPLYVRLISACWIRLLSLLSVLQRPKRVLELGTFTGYSSVCLSEGISAGGSWYDGASIVTVESDRVAAGVASQFFRRHEEETGRQVI
jgi:hypothetical protein